jgi:hypothetical protein
MHFRAVIKIPQIPWDSDRFQFHSPRLTNGPWHNFGTRDRLHRRLHAAGDALPEEPATVPNLGGVARLSYRHSETKLSFGYRAGFFFRRDRQRRKNETRGLYRARASISARWRRGQGR